MQDFSPITIPLGLKAHDFAARFALEYQNRELSKRVYLNTLAVYAVHRYLKWFEIDSNLDASDSWNLELLGIRDIGDLIVPWVGKLECRPVLPGQTTFTIPADVSEEKRIAYVPVQFEDKLDHAEILGFKEIVGTSDPVTEINLDSIADTTNLFQFLQRIRLENWPLEEKVSFEFFKKGVLEPYQRKHGWSTPKPVRELVDSPFLNSATVDNNHEEYSESLRDLLNELQEEIEIPDMALQTYRKAKINNSSEFEILIAAWPDSTSTNTVVQEITTDKSSAFWSFLVALNRSTEPFPRKSGISVMSLDTLNLLAESIADKPKYDFHVLFKAKSLEEALSIKVIYEGLEEQLTSLAPGTETSKTD